MVVGSERIPKNYVFDVFLWGGYAHVNPEKKEIYDNLKRTIAFPLLHNDFINVLKKLQTSASTIKNINRITKMRIMALYYWAGNLDFLSR